MIILTIVVLAGVGIGVYLYRPSPGTKPNQPPDVSQDPNGPYYHKIYNAISKDGLTWEKQDKVLFEHASVPGAVIKDGIIYLYFVDASAETSAQLSLAKSSDLGKTFEKQQKVEIKGSALSPVDPNPQLLASNKIRLYFFANPMTQGDPAKAEGPHKIYSAESSNGITFEDAKEAFQEENITDPDAFKTTDGWRMFVSKGTGLDLTISADDGLTFTKQDNFSWDQGGVSSTVNFNGTYRTYFCGQGGIASATGAETGKLTAENGTRITSNGQIVCDPTVVQLPDNTYMMFYKVQEITQNNGPNVPPSPPPMEQNQ